MIFFDNTKTENLTKEHFCDLLSASAKESLFIFNNSLYYQLDGVVMGFPLGPTIANAFLCLYEKK